MPGLVRMIALIVLCVLTVQMRAATTHPHPHALLHLVLDASDGVVDHHTAGKGATATDHASTASAHVTDPTQPDIPTFGDAIASGSGLAMLAAILTTVMIPPPCVERIWLRPTHWRGHLPTLEPPPPRLGHV